MKTEMLTARVPEQTIKAIEKFQEKHKIDFRTDALIKIVEIACMHEGINVPKTPEPQEEIKKIKCSVTNAYCKIEQCQNCFEKDRKLWNSCIAIPNQWREQIIWVSQGQEETEEFRDQAKTVDTIDKEETKGVAMFKGFIHCPKLKKDIHSSKCVEICKSAVDREACEEMRRERETKLK